ncbi:MAG TPA: hypothetical protein VKV26_10020 [Dehalococcoidia bacterium]|nr:hypothetical protein [Dehalococcoidia bacterium]
MLPRAVRLPRSVSAALLALAAIVAVGLLLLTFAWRRPSSSLGDEESPAHVAQDTGDPCSPGAEAHSPLNEAYKHPSADATAQAPGAYLGVWQPGAPEDMSRLADFERQAGKHVAIVMLWRDFAADAGALDSSWLCNIAEHGSVPLISWSPADFRTGADQTPYGLDNIIAGRFDSYIQGWAQQLATYGRPVLLR